LIERRIFHRVWRKRSCPNVTYFSGVCLKALREVTKDFSRYSWSPVSVSNPKPPEHESKRRHTLRHNKSGGSSELYWTFSRLWVKKTAFCDVSPYSLLRSYRLFSGTYIGVENGTLKIWYICTTLHGVISVNSVLLWSMFQVYFLMCLLSSSKRLSSFLVQFIECKVLAIHLMLPSPDIVVKQRKDQCVGARCTTWLVPHFIMSDFDAQTYTCEPDLYSGHGFVRRVLITARRNCRPTWSAVHILALHPPPSPRSIVMTIVMIWKQTERESSMLILLYQRYINRPTTDIWSLSGP
jgi:hypothetical protein